MLTATTAAAKTAKVDPIFAAIDAHRRATSVRYPIMEKMGAIADGLPERWVLEDAHDEAAEVEIAATLKLRDLQPTTVAGVMAAVAYFAEHIDHYPDCGWMGGEIAYDDPCWFGDGLIRSLAAALVQIGPAPVA